MRCKVVPVHAHVRATLPALAAISGSTNTMWNGTEQRTPFVPARQQLVFVFHATLLRRGLSNGRAVLCCVWRDGAMSRSDAGGSVADPVLFHHVWDGVGQLRCGLYSTASLRVGGADEVRACAVVAQALTALGEVAHFAGFRRPAPVRS